VDSAFGIGTPGPGEAHLGAAPAEDDARGSAGAGPAPAARGAAADPARDR
jgi:hypothetical protein